MKRPILSLLLVLIAASLYAQSSNSILIPAAGHAPGANGTFFRSDIAIHNLRATEQRVRLEWLPRSGTGQTFSRQMTILPNGNLQSDHFVEAVLETEGLGSIVVHPILADGSADLSARLAVSNRIWTPQPGMSFGNASQSFPAIRYSDINSSRLAIVGVRSDNQHRVNIGVVNLDRTSAQTFRISVEGLPSLTTEVTVEPYSMQQVSITGFVAPGTMRAIVEVLPLPGGGRLSLWTAYGSVVDNFTADSWSTIGVETTN